MNRFVKIKDAVRETGLSSYFFRNGCRDGSIPHIKSGNTFYIDLDALLQQLHEQAQQNKR